jgi:hypothetical protein
MVTSHYPVANINHLVGFDTSELRNELFKFFVLHMESGFLELFIREVTGGR